MSKCYMMTEITGEYKFPVNLSLRKVLLTIGAPNVGIIFLRNLDLLTILAILTNHI